jgi:uncharacterized protein
MLIPLIAAAFAGSVISGLIGMAGGSILLALMLFLGLEPLVVVPLHAAVQLVSNLTRTYAFRSHFRVDCWLALALAAVPGPIVGLWLLQDLDNTTIKAFMGIVVTYAAWAPKWGLKSLKDKPAFFIAGLLAGTFGVIIGAVGPLVAPFFLRGDFKKEAIIGTKAGCQATIHILKLAAFSGLYPVLLATEVPDFNFIEYLPLIVPMALATILGTYCGKALLRWVSEAHFVWMYKIALTLLGVKLFVGAWWPL